LIRIDYGNALRVGLPYTTIAPLQRVVNAAVRLVYGLRSRDHVSAAMTELHWRPVEARAPRRCCLVGGGEPVVAYRFGGGGGAPISFCRRRRRVLFTGGGGVERRVIVHGAKIQQVTTRKPSCR